MEIIDRETAQYIVDTVKSVCGKDINYIDARGIIIASTDHSRVDSFHEIGYQVVTQGDTKEASGDESFWGVQKGVNLPVFYHGKVIAAVGISGDAGRGKKICSPGTENHHDPFAGKRIGSQRQPKEIQDQLYASDAAQAGHHRLYRTESFFQRKWD